MTERAGSERLAEVIAEQVTTLGRRLLEYVDGQISTLHLTVPQAMLLRQLDQPLPMNQVAGRLHCDASNVTGIVDRLEARGLVERRVRPEDRRVKEIVLTEEGRRVREQVNEVISRTPGAGRLSSGEQATLRSLLTRALQDFGEDAAH